MVVFTGPGDSPFLGHTEVTLVKQDKELLL